MDNTCLRRATSWWYQLQGDVSDDIDADVFVTDIDAPLPKLRFNRLGVRCTRLAYLSVGEAEDYRYYWKDLPSDLIIHENPDWRGNYAVKFWDGRWLSIIEKRIAHAAKRGFDGVYLDKCDVINDIDGDREDEMMTFIIAIRSIANEHGMLVVMQNAEDLLADYDVCAALDGVGVEDLFYGADNTGESNNYLETKNRIRLLRASNLPVFVVEYLNAAWRADTAMKALTAEKFVPLIRPEDRELNA